MNNTVLTANQQLQNEIKKYYHDHIVPSNNQYIKLLIKSKTFTISVYTSGKVVFQGKDAVNEYHKWQPEQLSLFGDEKPTINETNLKLDYIGSDETGTGDVFGPVCVCACYYDAKAAEVIQDLNIIDSKLLNDEYIERITPQLLTSLTYEVVVVDNKQYNKMINQGHNQGGIKAYAHNKAINNLRKKVPDKTPIVMDQFVNQNAYYKYLKYEPVVVRDIHFETKAENKYLAVALASIIARYTYIKEMERISYQVDFTIPKGATAIVDEAIVRIIETYDKSLLTDIAKLHFSNIQKIIN